MSQAKAVRAFREAHGAPQTWSAVDYEVHQNLVLVALAARRTRRVNRFKARVVVLAIVAYTIPLYAVEALLDQVRGVPRSWPWLERRLDRASDRFGDAEDACNQAGETRFMERVKAATDRLEDAVLWVAARMAWH